MRTIRNQTMAFAIALALLLSLAPLAAMADHGPAPAPVISSARFDVDQQLQVLRPEIRGEINLAGLPIYEINASYDPAAGVIRAEEIVTFTNPTEAPLDNVVFRLLPNANSIYGGGSLTVQGIWRGGEPVEWAISPGGTILTASLQPSLGAGETIELLLGFVSVVPRSGSGYRIFHQSSSVISLAGWHPVLAPYDGGWQTPTVPQVGDANHFETALYDVTFKAPSAYTVVATGNTVERYQEGDLTVWRLASGPARGFALALSDRFQVLRTERNGVAINYYALPASAGSRSPQEALQIAADSLSVFSRRFGSYPYNEFDVVETNVTVSGYEFAGMVSIATSLRSSGSLSQLRFIVSHEAAHQWWFALVGSNPVEEPWLDEALATYSVAVYAEDTNGWDAGRAMVASFRTEAGAPNGTFPGIRVSALNYGSWASYRGPVYYRGAMFLDALRSEMGDDAFFGMLRQYTHDHRFGIATTRDLTNLAEQHAGRPLDDLYLLWFGTAEPGA